MKIQYKQTVEWDLSLIDVGFLGSEQSVPSAIRGLAINGVKITTGAPSAKAGRWARGAMVSNAIDGTVYIMNGTTAVPTWELIEAGTISLADGKILVGNAQGVATAVTPSGDVTISNAGEFTIADNAVDNDKIADDAVDTLQIADGAVDGSKIGITDQAEGDILYFNGTSWVRLAKGTAGQVLTMNAGATAPEWQTQV